MPFDSAAVLLIEFWKEANPSREFRTSTLDAPDSIPPTRGRHRRSGDAGGPPRESLRGTPTTASSFSGAPRRATSSSETRASPSRTPSSSHRPTPGACATTARAWDVAQWGAAQGRRTGRARERRRHRPRFLPALLRSIPRAHEAPRPQRLAPESGLVGRRGVIARPCCEGWRSLRLPKRRRTHRRRPRPIRPGAPAPRRTQATASPDSKSLKSATPTSVPSAVNGLAARTNSTPATSSMTTTCGSLLPVRRTTTDALQTPTNVRTTAATTTHDAPSGRRSR